MMDSKEMPSSSLEATAMNEDADKKEEDLLIKPQLPEFYDPDIDTVNEVWAAQQRKNRKSDAVLSCPGCFTTLCIDCQRHELYIHQYRAMFVRNCKVVQTERLQFQLTAQRKRWRNGRRKGRQRGDQEGGGPVSDRVGMISVSETSNANGDEIYKPVRCVECETEVGFLDSEEIYHFFNVMPSYS